jgi:hypothetical protein
VKWIQIIPFIDNKIIFTRHAGLPKANENRFIVSRQCPHVILAPHETINYKNVIILQKTTRNLIRESWVLRTFRNLFAISLKTICVLSHLAVMHQVILNQILLQAQQTDWGTDWSKLTEVLTEANWLRYWLKQTDCRGTDWSKLTVEVLTEANWLSRYWLKQTDWGSDWRKLTEENWLKKTDWSKLTEASWLRYWLKQWLRYWLSVDDYLYTQMAI